MKNKCIYICLIFNILFCLACNHRNYPKHSKKLQADKNLFSRIYTDSTYKITEGLYGTEISYLSGKGEPMKIFILEMDLNNPTLDIKVSTPNNENNYGMQPMTQQAHYMDQEGQRVMAGFNSDFFNMQTGVPRGILYREGKELKTHYDKGDRGFIAITKDRKALVGTASEFPETSKKLNFQEATGGGPLLLREGKILPQKNVTIEPRTCIGISSDSTRLYMLAVDGRDKPYSNGMMLEELAACLKLLGAETALNLDGGGSTTYFIRRKIDSANNQFEIRNRPCDTTGERPVANGFVITVNK